MLIATHVQLVFYVPYSEHSAWFLHPESLDNLEDIHHSLNLAALNGSGYGTEHPRTTHCITAKRKEYGFNCCFEAKKRRKTDSIVPLMLHCKLPRVYHFHYSTTY